MYIQPGERGHTHKLHLPKAWARPCGLPATTGHKHVQAQTLDMRKPATELRPQASMIALAFFAFFMPAFFMTLLAFFAFFMAFITAPFMADFFMAPAFIAAPFFMAGAMALTLRRSNEEEEIKFADLDPTRLEPTLEPH